MHSISEQWDPSWIESGDHQVGVAIDVDVDDLRSRNPPLFDAVEDGNAVGSEGGVVVVGVDRNGARAVLCRWPSNDEVGIRWGRRSKIVELDIGQL